MLLHPTTTCMKSPSLLNHDFTLKHMMTPCTRDGLGAEGNGDRNEKVLAEQGYVGQICWHTWAKGSQPGFKAARMELAQMVWELLPMLNGKLNNIVSEILVL